MGDRPTGVGDRPMEEVVQPVICNHRLSQKKIHVLVLFIFGNFQLQLILTSRLELELALGGLPRTPQPQVKHHHLGLEKKGTVYKVSCVHLSFIT